MADLTNAIIAKILRAQAWERAKAELHSISHARYSSGTEDYATSEKFMGLVDQFIKEIEDEELY